VIRRLWSAVLLAGVDRCDPDLVPHVKAANLAALVGFLGSMVFCGILIAMGFQHAATAVGIGAFAYGNGFLLLRAGHPGFARFWIGTVFLAQILAATALLSTRSHVHVFFLIGVPMAYVLFAASERILRWWGAFASLLLFLACDRLGFEQPLESAPEGALPVISLGSMLTLVIGFTVVQRGFVRVLVRAEARQREFSITDELTGVPNRRHVVAQARQVLEIALRYRRELSVLMLDLDRFKEVNDTRGHAAGDAVLKAVAACLHGNLRRADILGRHGGEEFVVLLPETDAAGAVEVAERIRSRVEGLPIGLEDGNASVTVSIGVSALSPGEEIPFDALLRRADEAMYHAKRAGRNRVVTWTPAVAAEGTVTPATG
jgi:diguanylate cyclase (GGDEF)-like protein